MRIAGAVVLIASFMAAIVFLLLPTSVTVFATEADCGPPIVRVVDKVTSDEVTDLEDQCFGQSRVRVFIGAALLFVGATGGGLMVALGGESRED